MISYQVEIVSEIAHGGGVIQCTDRCDRLFGSIAEALVFGHAHLGQVEGECRVRIVESGSDRVVWEEPARA